MLVGVLVAVAIVFLLLGFLHVVGLVVGLAVAVVCALVAIVFATGAFPRRA